MAGNEDDKTTVVLDLNALNKQKLKQEEDLANIGSSLEFNVGPMIETENTLDTEAFAEEFLHSRKEAHEPEAEPETVSFRVILFDYQSEFFQQSVAQFPQGFDYQIATNLNDLNTYLVQKKFQVVVFNYDVNPKVVNHLSAQIKTRFKHTKIMIMAKVISSEKAKIHAKSPSGANGYYQFPLEPKKIESELLKIHQVGMKANKT